MNFKEKKDKYERLSQLMKFNMIFGILAFYFGRENYEAGTEQVLALTRSSLDDLKVKYVRGAYQHTVRTILSKNLESFNCETQ